jgi:hypothetical protein
MKVLTLKQPWAWMVAHGGKCIENRPWTTTHRGEFLIHAGAKCSQDEYEQACDFAFGVSPHLRTFAIPGSEELGGPWTKFLPALQDLPFGGIVGIARLVDVMPRLTADEPHESWSHSWRMFGQYSWLLEDVRPVPFIPLKGYQRWWNFDWMPTWVGNKPAGWDDFLKREAARKP